MGIPKKTAGGRTPRSAHGALRSAVAMKIIDLSGAPFDDGQKRRRASESSPSDRAQANSPRSRKGLMGCCQFQRHLVKVETETGSSQVSSGGTLRAAVEGHGCANDVRAAAGL